MIETSFDNCVGPLHCFVVLMSFSWDREKALLNDGRSSTLKRWALEHPKKMGARAPLKDGRSSPLKCRGTTQLE